MTSSGRWRGGAGVVYFSNKNWEGGYNFYLTIFGGGSVLKHYTFLNGIVLYSFGPLFLDINIYLLPMALKHICRITIDPQN